MKLTLAAITLLLQVAVGFSQSAGTGTVTVAGTTHTFNVTVCSFHGEQPFPVKMIGGRATDADGKLLFNVELMAQEAADTAEHSAQVVFIDRQQFIAQYSKNSGTWAQNGKPSAGGLIRTQGLKTIAEGVFQTGGDDEERVSIEVNCIHQE